MVSLLALFLANNSNTFFILSTFYLLYNNLFPATKTQIYIKKLSEMGCLANFENLNFF